MFKFTVQLTKDIQKDGIISYATIEVNKTTDNGAFTNELTKTGDGTVTYASSNEVVATVNATTGEVTIVGAGTATITATVADSANYIYAVKTASYSLTVTKVSGKISYATVAVSKTTADSAFINELTNTGDGTVTYASSNEEVATVNATTGEVTIVAGGTATITATVADSVNYTYEVKTASYTIMIVPEGFVKVIGGTFDGTSTLTPESNVFISGRNITINDLYVCDHEVTQKEYATYMVNYGDAVRNNNYKWNDTYGKGDDYPAYFVNWYETIIYCNLRSLAENLTPAYYLTVSGNKKTDPADWVSRIKKDASGKYYYNNDTSSSSVLDYKGETDEDGGIQCDFTANGYRLPTEAEWEYIARGGSEWKEYTYSGSNEIGDVAWYRDNSGGKTHEVKTKAANTLGIYDMSGNVYEWFYDWFDTIKPDTGAAGAASGSHRVWRGGSWNAYVSECTVALRYCREPYVRIFDYGFRVVRNAQ